VEVLVAGTQHQELRLVHLRLAEMVRHRLLVLLPQQETRPLVVIVRIPHRFNRSARTHRHKQEQGRVAQAVEAQVVEEAVVVRRPVAAAVERPIRGELERFLSARGWPICPKWHPF
jgi:hypothetical protein